MGRIDQGNAGYWLRDLLTWVLLAVAFFAVWCVLFRKFVEKHGMGGFITLGESAPRSMWIRPLRAAAPGR
jgi:hypothetical protein